MMTAKFKAETQKHVAILEEQARFLAHGPMSSLRAESQCAQLVDCAVASIDAAVLALRAAVDASKDKEFTP